MNFTSRTHKEQRAPHLSSTPQVWKRDPATSEQPRDGSAKSSKFPTLAKLISATSLVFALCFCSCSNDAKTELQKAEARFVPVAQTITSTLKRDGVRIVQLDFDVASNSQVVYDPDPYEVDLVQDAISILKKVPCSIPGFSTWNDYVLGQVSEIRLYRPFMGGESAGSVDIDSPERMGDFIYFRNAAGNAVMLINPEAPAHMPTTMVHEATHLYPLPIPFDSPQLSITQALELTASAIELRFYADYQRYLGGLPESERQFMPDFSELPGIKFDEHLPQIMANNYGKSKFNGVFVSSFITP